MIVFFSGVHRPSEIKMVRPLPIRTFMATYFDVYKSLGGAKVTKRVMKLTRTK